MLTVNEGWNTAAAREFSTTAISAAAGTGAAAAAGPNSSAGGGKNAAGYLNTVASTGDNNTHLLIITVQIWLHGIYPTALV